MKKMKILLCLTLLTFLVVLTCLAVGSAWNNKKVSNQAKQASTKTATENFSPEDIKQQERVSATSGVTKQLLISIDKETGKATRLMVEVWNETTGNLDYIEIPVDGKCELNNYLYRQMVAYYPTMPQIFSLSVISSYFGEDYRDTFMELIMEAYLEIYLEDTLRIKEAEWDDYLVYLEQDKDKVSYVYCHDLPGEKKNDGFHIDVIEAGHLFMTLSNNAKYTLPQ